MDTLCTFSAGADSPGSAAAPPASRKGEPRFPEAAGVASGTWITRPGSSFRTLERSRPRAGPFPSLSTFIEQIYPADRKALLDTIAAATKSGADSLLVPRTIWPTAAAVLSGAGRFQLDEPASRCAAWAFARRPERRALERDISRHRRWKSWAAWPRRGARFNNRSP